MSRVCPKCKLSVNQNHQCGVIRCPMKDITDRRKHEDTSVEDALIGIGIGLVVNSIFSSDDDSSNSCSGNSDSFNSGGGTFGGGGSDSDF